MKNRNPIPAGDKSTTSSVYDFASFRLMNYFRQLNIEYFIDAPIIYGGAFNRASMIYKIIEKM